MRSLRLHVLPLGVAAALALALALAVLLGAAPARAATSYVALGDSYAAGVGTRSYYADSGTCYRSPLAYPVLGAARLGATLAFRACSGARTTDVLERQLGALSSATAYVTVQAGGNDAGFARVLTICAQPAWATDCGGAVDTARAFIRSTLPGRLRRLYDAVRGRAPNARVVVVGYPRLFMGEDCNAGTWFGAREQTRLNATADLLNATLASAASAAGFGFANPTAAFAGHAVCDGVEWINGLSNPVRESYHPNRRGQAGYADVVDDLLG